MNYLPRVIDTVLDELLASLAAVALEGPKGVGKTETAKRRAETVFALDSPEQASILEADPSQILIRPRPVLIDEWQRIPTIWDTVRRAVDSDHSANQFLLTGSASPRNPPTHSGAGRIVSLRMRPLALFERGVGTPTVSFADILRGHASLTGETDIRLQDYVHELVTPGLPGLRHLSGRALRSQLDGYIRRVVDRDFGEQGHAVRNVDGLIRWMTAYAAATATTTSFEKIRNAASGGDGQASAKTTIQHYREILEQLWILDPVLAWLPTRNKLSSLSRPPKHHLADPALAVRLLGLDEDSLLAGSQAGPPIVRDGSLLGHLFESLVTLSVKVCAQAAESTVRHFRTQGGRKEVDLIVVRPDQKVVAVEVKLSATVNDSDVDNLLWLRDQLGADLIDAVVINTGSTAYRRPDGIGVLPAALLGP
jgi:uncharacterized protein